MASSDEEGEIVPDCVSNYHLVDSSDEPVSFSTLPLHWSDQETVIESDSENGDGTVFLLGTSDGGQPKVHKEVIGWRLELSYVLPEVHLLSKGKIWITLQKPRRSYEYVIKSVLVVIRCLHFAKRNLHATRDQIASHLMKTLSSDNVVEPLEKHLAAYVALIRIAVANDMDLAQSKYLKTFLMDIENPGRSGIPHEENQTTNKSKFIVSDDEMGDDDDYDDEAEIFDSVCAFCDNGGDVLPCEGKCLRSFHPTIVSGVDTCCESLGFANAAQHEAIPTFLCPNCQHQKHQCFACGMLGSSDKNSAVEVFPCVSATCGHFYHPECVSKLLYPSDETLASELQSRIAAGESFTCPIHKCQRCLQGENKEDHDFQFAVCRRCPRAYHRKCLPKTIVFEASADGKLQQRAWDDLLPKRILIYCMRHTILPKITTPRRDHLLFPSITRKRDQEGNKTEIMSERRSKAYGNFTVNSNKDTPKVIDSRYKTVTSGNTTLKKGKSSIIHEKKSSFEDKVSISRNPYRPLTIVERKSTHRDTQKEQRLTFKPLMKVKVAAPPEIDTDIKTRMLKLIKDTEASFDFEEFVKEKKRKCTHQIYTPQTGLDKMITMGKVEASVKAVRTALKTLEDGGSVEDAKAVCEPNVLSQLVRWKKKLHVFLAPFLHGARYTSFGRHFTKVDKLKEIVDRLHCYVEDGDMIVDFCCGSNDFSQFMKEKLDSTGKKCSFRNYDLITPKNAFKFEKKDWFSVPVDALPEGSRLIMGLNPPFGVQASLANKFIDHALKFKPKLIILIVPKETKRLDQKRSPYDLIWEEEDMLSGKSFYLPGSRDLKNKPLDDWNIVSPPLSLWSRPDYTTKHKKIAEKNNHIKQNQNKESEKEKEISSYLMEVTRDCYDDFSNIVTKYPDISTILDDVPEDHTIDMELDTQPSQQTQQTQQTQKTSEHVVDMNLYSPITSPTNSIDPPTTLNPTQYVPYPGFYPPQYPNTSLQYASGYGAGYTQPGYTNYPSQYGQPDFVYANYGYASYPQGGPTFTYGQPSLTSQNNVWPPGTIPPPPPPDRN